METAILGGGCFWCLEAVYRGMKGILSIAPGYAGGTVQHPTYQQVCTGQTGHAEVIRLEFDPSIISYAEILRIFFIMHDPTTLNRQGNDKGTQYRSVIFYENDQQKQIAERTKRDIAQEKIWGAQPVVTEIQPLTTFWPAEEAHFDYYARNPMAGYCQVVISPKVAKARKEFARYFSPA